MTQDDIQEVEITIEQAREVIRKGELVEELENNPVFKELILEGYFRDEASRLVMLKADESMQEPVKQATIDKDILGVSVLGSWLRNQKLLANMARSSLNAHEATLVELREEAANGY